MKTNSRRTIIGIALLLLVMLGGYSYISYGLSPQFPIIPYSTIITDVTGKEIGEIVYQKTIRHQPLAFENIPKFYIDALVALEDQSFWSNNGISATGLIRSTWNNLLAGKVVEGGSTLSSGLVRNALWLNENRSLGKKLLEFIYAIRLNHQYSKEEILTEYINRVYYGYLNYGLTSASRYYFGKSPNNLTKAEQIALLSLPKDPKKYNPYKEQKAFKKRFDRIADTLQKNQLIGETEKLSILSEELHFNYSHDDALPYVADFIDHGMEKWKLSAPNTPTTSKEISLYKTNGKPSSHELVTVKPLAPKENLEIAKYQPATISTTIDAALTGKIDTLAKNTILDLAWKDVSDFSVIILDRKTNALLTMIGGANYHASEGQVNSALALRQPGSTIKPFTYLLAFENFGMKPEDTILDLPTAYKTSEGYEYDPKNYSLDYKGEITLADALSQSVNIPAVKLADKVGTENLLRFLRTAGFSSLKKDAEFYGLGLTLGNGEVSLYELTRAYSIFANEGRLCDIEVTSKRLSSGATAKDTLHSSATQNSSIRDSSTALRSDQNDNKQVRNPKPETQNCTRIASAKAISDINLILTNRYFKLGGFPIHSSLDFPDRNVFVKTGTSRNFRDNWAVGYTDNHIIGVWTGNKSGAFMKGVSGATGAGEIFSRIVYAVEQKNIEQLPVSLEKKSQQYLQITSPLSDSVYTLDDAKPKNTQQIQLQYSTNISHDSHAWIIDSQKINGNTALPSIGTHTLTIQLLLNEKIISEQRQQFHILENSKDSN